MKHEVCGIRYDAALAAGLLIDEMLETTPAALREARLAFMVYTILETLHETERRLTEARHVLAPSGP
jgi:hypothetical protein